LAARLHVARLSQGPAPGRPLGAEAAGRSKAGRGGTRAFRGGKKG
jgi:hypothetical protein